MRNLITAGLLALLAAITIAPAQAGRHMCGDRDQIIKRLETQYSETVGAIALSSDGALIEVTISPDGDWTMLITYPGRKTCIVSTGEAWRTIDPYKPSPDEQGA